jgi:hypothetical protein
VAGVHTAILQMKTADSVTMDYLAPELGCVSLKNVQEFRDEAGVLTQSVTREAFKVVIGEPEAALFDLSSYGEMDPKSAYDEWVRFNNREPAEYPADNSLLDREEDYRNFHQIRALSYGRVSRATFSACPARNRFNFSRRSGRELARMAIASSAALRAPAEPIARVPTGIPPGI